MKYLIVVDMQNDFTTGSLGSPHAAAIIPRVVDKVRSFPGKVIFTRDTHGEDYLSTQEGRNLPVVHCVKDTSGWQICDALAPYAHTVVDKETFGSVRLSHILGSAQDAIEEIELCGLCTDICVISNAMILKAAFPEVKIAVDAACCAGVTMESHTTALEAMKAVQIEIRNFT